jgi:hypothetical protein
MLAAKHAELLLPVKTASALFGSKNEGKGGGGIFKIAFGGSAFTHSKHELRS